MRKLIKWIGIALGACLLLAVVAAALNGGKGSATPTPAAAVASSAKVAEKAPAATTVAKATEAPKATPTPAPTATPMPAPKLGQVGQPMEAGGVAVTVNKVSRADAIGELWKPAEGSVYLVVDVTIATVSRDEAPYNPMYLKVKDADGFEYATAISAPDPTLKSGTCVKGEKVRGNVAFEVKSGASGFVLTYEPLVILGGYEPIRVALGG
jgi:hypothetical protein